MSHTSHAMLADLHRAIRAQEVEAGRPIGILVDLQGPKIRLGTLPGGSRILKDGEQVRFVRKVEADDPKDIPIPHPEVFAAMKMRHTLLIDDGRVRLRLLTVKDYYADAMVVVGGEIKDRKGVNLPDTLLPVSAMTPKDRTDLDAALNLGVDWIALSFVQRADDVAELKKVVAGPRRRARQDREAQGARRPRRHPRHFRRADGRPRRPRRGAAARSGARPPEADRPRRSQGGQPVVVATQMLESMIASAVPTRAEVSDVATAVFEGADAVMLSAETASGTHPVEAVQMMDRIAQSVENDPLYASCWRPSATRRRRPPATHHGRRPAGDAHHPRPRRGVLDQVRFDGPARLARASRGADHRADAAGRDCAPAHPRLGPALRADGGRPRPRRRHRPRRAHRPAGRFRPAGDRVVITAGIPLGTPGATNLLRVAFVGPKAAG